MINGFSSLGSDVSSGAAVGSAVPGIGTGLGAGLGALAGVGTGIADLISGGNQNAANAQAVQQLENYQTGMANTQYQRTVADLKAAGLNPMLAYMGSVDPTPQGTVAQPQNPVPGAIQSGLSTDLSLQSIGQTASQTSLNQQLISNAQQQFSNLSDADKGIALQNGILDLQKKLLNSNLPPQQIINQFWTDHPNLTKLSSIIQKIFSPGATTANQVTQAAGNAAAVVAP